MEISLVKGRREHIIVAQYLRAGVGVTLHDARTPKASVRIYD